MLQEYVPGPPTNHYFVDGYRSKDGCNTQFLARQRLQMSPPDFGNSTDMKTVALSEVGNSLETLIRFFEHTGFYGIFSAEFKRDTRDGQFKILEINGRPWWFIDYADRCGLHVSSAAYADALGLEIPAYKPYKLNKRGTYPSHDVEAYHRSSKRSVVRFTILVFNWMRSYQPIFCWSDPMPALVNFCRMLGTAMRRRISPVPREAAP
jgi:predicted ATP-grasp superfamily ATP-dependent carboligase